MAEKVIARTSGRDRVAPGEYVTARIDRVMCHEAFTPCALFELEIDIASGAVRNLTRAGELEGRPYAPEMLAILESGGLLAMLEARLERGAL